MSLGEDIKEMLRDDIGVSYDIYKSSENWKNYSGEYLEYELNSQVSDPFIREFFIEARLQYDTQAETGDLIKLQNQGQFYILMNKTPDIFENEAFQYNCVLYKTNVSGEVYRVSGERTRDPQTLELKPNWVRVAGTRALLTEKRYGSDIQEEEEIGHLQVKALKMFVPSSIDIQAMDRFQINPPSGEYFKVEEIAKYKFPNTLICTLAEDTR